jgi:hypothetical protein
LINLLSSWSVGQPRISYPCFRNAYRRVAYPRRLHQRRDFAVERRVAVRVVRRLEDRADTRELEARGVFGRPVLPPFISWRHPRALTSTPNFRAAVRIRRHAASRSASVTPSTWSKRAMALRTCLASLSGSLRFLVNAKVVERIRFCCRVLKPCDFLAMRAPLARLV